MSNEKPRDVKVLHHLHDYLIVEVPAEDFASRLGWPVGPISAEIDCSQTTWEQWAESKQERKP